MLDIIILGILQGITEWLPVSSSGHLVIYQQFFLEQPIIVDIMLHVATLVVIFLVFWKEILRMVQAVLRLDFSTDGKIALLIIAGSIPTAIIGLVFHDFLVSLYASIFSVALALILNGMILFTTQFFNGKRKLGPVDALVMGVAQGIAIIPGISRSGITITTGLFMGVKRKTVIAFSFLLSIPAVLGALVLEYRGLGDVEILPLIIGMLVSIVVGYVALRILINLALKNKLHFFSYYCWALGFLLLLFAT